MNLNERLSTMNSAQARPIADPHNSKPESTPANPLIEGVQTLEDWIAHREIVVQELCPVGALETLYAQRAALYLWRLERITRFEVAAKFGAIEARSTPTGEDSANAQEHRASTDPSTLQTIIKYEAHLQRCLAGTMAELRRLQKERRLGLRDANPAGRGADRAGVCEKESVEDGSHGGSRFQKITDSEMSISGTRGADRAGVCEKELNEMGSHGGSPTPKSPPSRQITSADMPNTGGRGADRAGVCQNVELTASSRGGSPSTKSSPPQKHSHSRKNLARRNASRSQRASPAPKIPPLLDAITRRRELCESIAGQTFEFERNLTSAKLDFSIGRCP